VISATDHLRHAKNNPPWTTTVPCTRKTTHLVDAVKDTVMVPSLRPWAVPMTGAVGGPSTPVTADAVEQATPPTPLSAIA
jgi:hypothetical protein